MAFTHNFTLKVRRELRKFVREPQNFEVSAQEGLGEVHVLQNNFYIISRASALLHPEKPRARQQATDIWRLMLPILPRRRILRL